MLPFIRMNRVKAPFTILIADRNRYVREFLKRELTGEGYRVILAKSAQEILDRIDDKKHVDLLILDLDVPGAKELSVLEKAEACIPPLPVVVHSFFSEYRDYSSLSSTTVFVEKRGTNIDHLKQVVLDSLQKSYPKRFKQGSDMGRHPAEEN